jgi:phosphatidyl-myo-inositol alpha-mannosyltransferase
MRVLLVCPYSWSVPGGVGHHIANLAEQLRHRGHEVRILAPSEGKAPPGVWSVGRSVPLRWNGSVARLAFGPRVATRVKVAMRRGRADVVHVHEPFAPSVSMMALARAKAPCVATFHTTASSNRLYRAAARGLRPLWNKLAVRIAVSKEAADTVQRIFKDPVRVIPNGIDIARFSSIGARRPKGKTILFFGRLERRKGVRVLVDAFAKLKERIPDVGLVVLGDGPERRRCEAAVPAAYRDDVTFAGAFKGEDLVAALGDAAVVCMPALGGESFGVVLLEAMAARRPLVATNIAGYAAVARDGIEALLVPPGDAEALAAALERVLTNRDLASTMAKAGRARAAEFDWSLLVVEVEKCYEEAVASRR